MTRLGTDSQPIPFPKRPRSIGSDAQALRALPSLSLNNLPTPATPFIGRDDEVDAICSLILDESVRLLTLTGPGGVEKTRLALRAAEEMLVADTYREHREFDQAHALYDQALSLSDELDKQRTIHYLVSRGLLLCDEGNYDQAEPLLNESLELAQASGDQSNVANAQTFLGRVALHRCDYLQARSLFHEALQTKPTSAPGLLDLTERELEVLRLLAGGLTNKEIAERLVLSYRTAQTYLYRIFNKLDVTIRTAATSYAIRLGLV